MVRVLLLCIKASPLHLPATRFDGKIRARELEAIDATVCRKQMVCGAY